MNSNKIQNRKILLLLLLLLLLMLLVGSRWPSASPMPCRLIIVPPHRYSTHCDYKLFHYNRGLGAYVGQPTA